MRTASLWLNRIRRGFNEIKQEVQQELHNDSVMQELRKTGQQLKEDTQSIGQDLKDATESLSNRPDDTTPGEQQESQRNNKPNERARIHDQPLPLVTHLTELRDKLLRALLAVLVMFICLFPFANEIYAFVSEPLRAILPPGRA